MAATPSAAVPSLNVRDDGNDAAAPVGEGREWPELEDLLRKILAHLSRAQAPSTSQASASSGSNEPAEVLDVLVDGLRYTLTRHPSHLSHPGATLSPREQEIVRLVTRGYSNKLIATMLDISAWTVATHLRRVFAKLEVGSRAEMAARAVDGGLLAKTGSIPSRP